MKFNFLELSEEERTAFTILSAELYKTQLDDFVITKDYAESIVEKARILVNSKSVPEEYRKKYAKVIDIFSDYLD